MKLKLIEKLKSLGDQKAYLIRKLFFFKEVTKVDLKSRFEIDAETLQTVLLKHCSIKDIVRDMFYREYIKKSLKMKTARIKSIDTRLRSNRST